MNFKFIFLISDSSSPSSEKGASQKGDSARRREGEIARIEWKGEGERGQASDDQTCCKSGVGKGSAGQLTGQS